jgi:hypothetical protein
MILAAYHVFGEAQGCKIAYIQSDEASFVLTDYDDLNTEAWFDYNKSKIESVTAALMSVAFGRALRLMNVKELAVFDARAFNVPEAEVANYLLWRAKDWHRNSVQMLAQHHFSHKELQGRSLSQCLTMLTAIGHPWDRLSENEKNGTFLMRELDDTHQWRIAERTDVRDYYLEIAQLWDAVNPSMNLTTAPATSSGSANLGARSTELKNGVTGSADGCTANGTPPRNNAIKPAKTLCNTLATSSKPTAERHSTAKSTVEIGKEYNYLGQPVTVLAIDSWETIVQTRFGINIAVPTCGLKLR